MTDEQIKATIAALTELRDPDYKDEYYTLLAAVEALHAAKGRYNTQIAAARLFELAGLPAIYPANYKPTKEQ